MRGDGRPRQRGRRRGSLLNIGRGWRGDGVHLFRQRTVAEVRPRRHGGATRAHATRRRGACHGCSLLTFPEVNLQDVGQHEALSAVVADVGALAVVRLPVHPHVPRRREPLLTDLADVALLVGRRRSAFASFSVGPHDGRRRGPHHARAPGARGIHDAHRAHSHRHPPRRHFVRHRRAPRSRSARTPFSASGGRWAGHHVRRDCRRCGRCVGVGRYAAKGASGEMATRPGRHGRRRGKGKRRGDAAHPRHDSRGRRRRRLLPRGRGLATRGPHLPGPHLSAAGSTPVRSRRPVRSPEGPWRRMYPSSWKWLMHSSEGVGTGRYRPRRAMLSHLGVPRGRDVWRHPWSRPRRDALAQRKSSSVVC